MTDNLARELLDGMSPHERLVQWLEEELRRAIHTTPPDHAEMAASPWQSRNAGAAGCGRR